MYHALNPEPEIGVNSAVEQVEILDNGKHLGYADLIDGKWQYVAAGLDVEEHAITAVYKAITSSPWQLTVRRVETHYERFDVAISGPIGNVKFNYFQALVTQYGNLGNHPDSHAVGIYDIPSGVGTGKWLSIVSEWGPGPDFGYYNTELELKFDQTYSAVSFTQSGFVGRDGGGLNASVTALSESKEVLSAFYYPNAYLSPRNLSLQAGEGKRIRYLKFTTNKSGTGVENWHSIRVDNIVMTT